MITVSKPLPRGDKSFIEAFGLWKKNLAGTLTMEILENLSTLGQDVPNSLNEVVASSVLVFVKMMADAGRSYTQRNITDLDASTVSPRGLLVVPSPMESRTLRIHAILHAAISKSKAP